MKQALLSFLFLVLPLLATAQKFKAKTELPNKDSNVILVETGLSDEEAFKVAGRTLIKDGYKIDKSDANFFSVSTAMETRNDYNFKFAMNIGVINGSIIVRGKATNAGYSFDPYYGKGKGIIVSVLAFKFMNEYSQSLLNEIQGSKRIYAIE